MKKTITTIILLSVIALSVYAQAYDPESDFTVATIDNGRAVRITDYKGNKTTINIPPRINNLPVTEIGDSAFKEKGLTSITIPSGVTSIGLLAFYKNRLVSVTIPNTVTIIKGGAFAQNNLTSVVIPNSVTVMWAESFAGNNILEITIGANVQIGEGAFDNGFKDFYLASGSAAKTYTRNGGYWCDYFENGFAINALNNGRSAQIVGYSGTSTNIQIPSQIRNLPVTSIGDNAFASKRLTTVVIPNSVTSIGANAFSGNALTTITIGSNVTLGSTAFGIFNNLYTATGRRAGTYNSRDRPRYWYEFIENGYAGIILSGGKSVMITGYSGTDSALQIPSQIRNLPVAIIGYGAFQNKGITSVIIPGSVIFVDNHAFADKNISYAIALSGATNINANAFLGTDNTLFNLWRFESNNPKLTDQKFGAVVFLGIQIARFLNDTALVNKHEAILQYVIGRGNVTRAEIEAYSRDNNNIRAIISQIVDEEFNTISVSLARYNASLTRNPQNGQYTLRYKKSTLRYEGVNTDIETKFVTANSLEALVTEMRNGTNKADFTSADLTTVRAQAALIPAVAFPASTRDDAVRVITAFFQSPNRDALHELGVKYRTFSLNDQDRGRAAASSFIRAIDALNGKIADRVLGGA